MNANNLSSVFAKHNVRLLYFQNVAEMFDYLNIELCIPINFALGGSKTLEQLGLKEVLIKNGHKLSCDNNCDVYFSGANAITCDGLIVNVDRRANRVSAIAHGAEKVYIIVGKNKLVQNFEEAIWRIKNVAAPLNAKRLNANTPCAISGHCVSFDSFHGCNSSDRLCCQYLITAHQKIPDRITVMLINKELGF